MEMNGSIPFKYPPALFIFLLLINISSIAQKSNENFSSKISPVLALKINSSHTTQTHLFRITLKGKQLPLQLLLQKFKSQKIAEYDDVSFYKISATTKELFETIIPLQEVMFIEDETRTPKEEAQVNNLDLGTNKINKVHKVFPQWNGEGITVSVKENKPDTADIDFAGRYIPTALSSAIVSSHATNMATMIAGAGNSWYLGKGAAWAAKITSSSYENLLPDPNAYLQQYNITVQNHSYGVGIENFYGADAAAYDAQAIANSFLMLNFSSGNSGLLASATGIYSGITGFANITGSFKMAKNILTVGATDSFGTVAIQSSRGPAYDGRIKPELVAFGIDGSSGAAALVSGVSLMLQQEYKQIYNALPANALIRAVLLNSADDRGNKEVDYSNGFGSLNALNAVRTIAAGRFLNANVSNSTTQSFPLSIPAGIKKIKITLLWNNPPATVNTAKALVNDLDLVFQNTATNETWKPWVLNSFPQIDSLKKIAIRKRDSLNNIEQVTLENPAAGNYQIIINGFAVSTASQNFYIAYQLDSADIFEWHFPTSLDPVFPGMQNSLRWNSSFAATTGRLEYSINNGANWQLINATADLTKEYYNWNSPAINSAALLKMTIGTLQFVSDSFVIADRTQTGVGFNCSDSLLFYWHKLPAVNTYRLYSLGSRYMEPRLITTDSFVVLQKNINPTLYYAVAPVISGKEGVRSYTINYSLQGVQCYFKTFLATLVNNTIELNASLGTLYNIQKIVLEKFDGLSFKPIQQLLNINSLDIKFTDTSLKKGLNIYRIKLELAGGGIIYSANESAFYFKESNYVVYPNPAAQYQLINIAQQNVNDAIMQVFNTAGVKVFEKIIDDRINIIPAGRLSKGFYFIRISRNNKREETLKLVVY